MSCINEDLCNKINLVFRFASLVASLDCATRARFRLGCRSDMAPYNAQPARSAPSPQMMRQHLEAHALERLAFVFVERLDDPLLRAPYRCGGVR